MTLLSSRAVKLKTPSGSKCQSWSQADSGFYLFKKKEEEKESPIKKKHTHTKEYSGMCSIRSMCSIIAAGVLASQAELYDTAGPNLACEPEFETHVVEG